jgi:hypothetical protein
MKSEKRILSTISSYGCLIIAITSENKIISLMFLAIAIIWFIRYLRIKDEPKN